MSRSFSAPRVRLVAWFVALSLVMVFFGTRDSSVAGTVIDLDFKERACGLRGTECTFVDDTRPDGFGSFGDRFVFTLPLESPKDGARLGREQGECVLLHRESDKFYCTFNVYLEGGSISVQGTFAGDRRVTATIPITGGSGQFEGAYGSLTQTGSHVALHILTPA